MCTVATLDSKVINLTCGMSLVRTLNAVNLSNVHV